MTNREVEDDLVRLKIELVSLTHEQKSIVI